MYDVFHLGGGVDLLGRVQESLKMEEIETPKVIVQVKLV